MDINYKQRAAENLYENYMRIRKELVTYKDLEMFAKPLINLSDDFKEGFIEGAKEIIKIFFE